MTRPSPRIRRLRRLPVRCGRRPAGTRSRSPHSSASPHRPCRPVHRPADDRCQGARHRRAATVDRSGQCHRRGAQRPLAIREDGASQRRHRLPGRTNVSNRRAGRHRSQPSVPRGGTEMTTADAMTTTEAMTTTYAMTAADAMTPRTMSARSKPTASTALVAAVSGEEAAIYAYGVIGRTSPAPHWHRPSRPRPTIGICVTGSPRRCRLHRRHR